MKKTTYETLTENYLKTQLRIHTALHECICDEEFEQCARLRDLAEVSSNDFRKKYGKGADEIINEMRQEMLNTSQIRKNFTEKRKTCTPDMPFVDMIINFPTQISVTTQPAKTVTFSAITVIRITDYPSQKLVVAETKELGSIKLWFGVEYDAIGQWTDAQVAQKIQEKYLTT